MSALLSAKPRDLNHPPKSHRVAGHPAEWGTRAGHRPGVGGEGTARATQAMALQRKETAMAKPYFRYTKATQTVHEIPVGMKDQVAVVGDPDNGLYEWVIRTPDGVIDHSDDGYGSPEIALRDGLIAYCGLPVQPNTP